MGNKAPLKPSEYTIEMALMEAARYEGIYVGDNFIIKDHGSHVQVMVEADNKKGHISFDLFFDEEGRFTHYKAHKSN